MNLIVMAIPVCDSVDWSQATSNEVSHLIKVLVIMDFIRLYSTYRCTKCAKLVPLRRRRPTKVIRPFRAKRFNN